MNRAAANNQEHWEQKGGSRLAQFRVQEIQPFFRGNSEDHDEEYIGNQDSLTQENGGEAENDNNQYRAPSVSDQENDEFEQQQV